MVIMKALHSMSTFLCPHAGALSDARLLQLSLLYGKTLQAAVKILDEADSVLCYVASPSGRTATQASFIRSFYLCDLFRYLFVCAVLFRCLYGIVSSHQWVINHV